MSNALKSLAMLFPPIKKIQQDRERLREENARLLDSKGVMLAEMTRALTVEKSAKQGENDANSDLSAVKSELLTVSRDLGKEVENLRTALDEKTSDTQILQARVNELETQTKSLKSELYIKQIQVEGQVSRPSKPAAPTRTKKTRSKTAASRAKTPASKVPAAKRGPKKKSAGRSSSEASEKV